MPILSWIGKDAVINHHLEVPVKTLEKKYTEGSENSENKIIHGDNLEALKALLPEYEGRVKCVYIDPPYNTGNENWVYNDNVNSPRIRKWLGEVVGKETEDLTRHDKWLCMMFPRLKLLHQLLADDGYFFCSLNSIDENSYCRCICDDIFSKQNFIGELTWESTTQPANSGSAKFNLQQKCEPIFVYAKNKKNHSEFFLKELESNLKYPHNGKFGPCRFEIIEKSDAGEYTRPSMRFAILGQYPREGKRWQIGEDTARELEKTRKVEIVEGIVKRAIYPEDELDKRKFEPFWSLLSAKEVGTAQSGKGLLNTILERAVGFDTVKPVELIQKLLRLTTRNNDIILDSFSGSGTTAHAVLNLNKRDGGNRKFILVEMEDYAESITAERVRRVINGYPFKGKVEEEIFSKKLTVKNILNAENILQEAEVVAEERQPEFEKISIKIQDNCIKVIGTKVFDEMMEGTGGDFSFYELGEAIMVNGNLNDKLDVETIREFVWYSETHSPYTKQKYAHPYLLGRHDDTDYYFYYEPGKETTLDRDFLATITQKAERYLIYADNCLLPQDDMAKYNIVFKKIPRDIKTF